MNNGSTANIYNRGFSNGYPTGEKYAPRFDVDHPYAPPDKPFLFSLNNKIYHEHIYCHSGKLHDLRNNCVIEEILPEPSGIYKNFHSIHVIEQLGLAQNPKWARKSF